MTTTVRPLDLLDLPFLGRYRSEVLPLESARFLTRGNPLRARALLDYLDLRQNVYTAVAVENGAKLIGQIVLPAEASVARLVFLSPRLAAESLTVPLLEHLVAQAGEWGAFAVVAEVEENAALLPILRRSGFAIYAWQRIWKLPPLVSGPTSLRWQAVREEHWAAVQSLHAQIVPALLQNLDGLPKSESGLIYLEAGEMNGYVAVTSGPEGIWIQPLISPDCADASQHLAALRTVIGGTLPLFVCVRSYQAWLESALEEIGALPGVRQAVMVKRLTLPVREGQSVSALEKVLARAKPAAPVSHLESPPSKVSQISKG